MLTRLGAVPKTLVWDNDSVVGRWRGGRPQLTAAMNVIRGSLGITIVQCRPADPEVKGLAVRQTAIWKPPPCPADFNTQLTDGWSGPTSGITAGVSTARLIGWRLIWPRWCRSWRVFLWLPGTGETHL
ncbi:hypothetical protein ACIBH1_45010 [Nonomuraea sp. NPDC050663]|uniref:hypothetical protein n=1 Tax=Nonomuraea sp. NPDC050663 TaxID=3364370 RepID=UPI0037A7451A